MALPRFSFSGGATDFFQPNQALFRTTFTPSDKLQSDTYQAEAKAYKDAVEKYNKSISTTDRYGHPVAAPPKPTPISFTQKDFDQFGVDASRRAQQLQNAKQNTFNAISNPSGFSQQYGIGSLGFEEGGEVPVNFVGTEEFPEALNRAIERLNRQAELTPIEQNSILGTAAKGIKAVRDFGNKATVPDFIPLMGGQGVGDLFVGQAPEEIENLSYGNYPFDMPYQGTGGYLPRVKPNRQTSLADTVFLGGGLLPVGAVAKSAVKGATPKAAEMLENAMRKTGGILDDAPSGPRTVTKKSPSLDTLKTKPKPIASSDSNAFEVLNITEESKEAWKKANRLPNKNKPPEANRQALIEQVKLLEEGKSTTNQFRNFVDTNFSYYFHEAVPEVASFERIANSLPQKTSIIKNGIIGVNKQIPEGTLVGSRYDVNGFQDFGTYVGTIHNPAKKGEVYGYSPTAALKDVMFETKEGASLKIAKGSAKSPVIRMEGNWVEHSSEELRQLAKEALEQNKNLPLAEQEWVQVAVNPAKGASWVALEKTADGVRTMPITNASQVIQIGKLVLARKPKLQSWDDYYKTASFEDGGEVGEGIASLRPSETSMGLSPYGVRHSGEGLKGKGYFGEIQSPSGQSVTEYSLYDEDIGEYPSIVPTLTAEELQDTIRRSSQGEQPSIEVIMKARMYAKDRLSDGKSTFSGPTELRFPVPSNTDDDMIRRIDAYLEKNRP